MPCRAAWETTWIAVIESPPSARKLSESPTRSVPSSRARISASCRSRSERGSMYSPRETRQRARSTAAWMPAASDSSARTRSPAAAPTTGAAVLRAVSGAGSASEVRSTRNSGSSRAHRWSRTWRAPSASRGTATASTPGKRELSRPQSPASGSSTTQSAGARVPAATASANRASRSAAGFPVEPRASQEAASGSGSRSGRAASADRTAGPAPVNTSDRPWAAARRSARATSAAEA